MKPNTDLSKRSDYERTPLHRRRPRLFFATDDTWKSLGKYFGFPKCCIKHFCDYQPNRRRGLYMRMLEKSGFDTTGFIPCFHHVRNVRQALALINRRRICKHPYKLRPIRTNGKDKVWGVFNRFWFNK